MKQTRRPTADRLDALRDAARRGIRTVKREKARAEAAPPAPMFTPLTPARPGVVQRIWRSIFMKADTSAVELRRTLAAAAEGRAMAGPEHLAQRKQAAALARAETAEDEAEPLGPARQA